MPGDLLLAPNDPLAAVAEILKKALEDLKATQISMPLLDDRGHQELGPQVFLELLPADHTVFGRLDDL